MFQCLNSIPSTADISPSFISVILLPLSVKLGEFTRVLNQLRYLSCEELTEKCLTRCVPVISFIFPMFVMLGWFINQSISPRIEKSAEVFLFIISLGIVIMIWSIGEINDRRFLGFFLLAAYLFVCVGTLYLSPN